MIQLRFFFIGGAYQAKDYFRNEKPSIVRSILGVSSFVWAISVIIQPGTFDRPNFVHIKTFLGMTEYLPAMWEPEPRTAEIIWGLMFFLHGLGLALIARYKPKTDTWPLLVNAYGLTLWMLTSLGLNWAVHAFSPGSSMEFTVCAFATWALYRTEFHHGPPT